MSQDQLQEALRAGDAFSAEKKFVKARAEYEKAAAIHEAHLCLSDVCATAYFKLGESLLSGAGPEQETSERAAAAFLKAVELKPAYPEAHCRRGDALLLLKKYEEAIRSYREAARLRPTYPEAYKGWGNALFKKRDYRGAISKYETAQAYRPDYSAALFNWGLALSELEADDLAIEKYERVIALGEVVFAASNNLGRILVERREYERAAEKFDAAQQGARTKSEKAIAYNNWGDALYHLGRYDLAVEKFREAQELDETYALAFHNEAFVYMHQGRYRDARRVAGRAKKAYAAEAGKKEYAEEFTFFEHYGELLHKVAGDLEEAEQAYCVGLRLRPDSIDIQLKLLGLYADLREDQSDLDRRAALYWKTQELYQNAERRLKAVLAEKEEAETLHRLGRLLLAKKDYEMASKFLRAAVEKAPEMSEPLADLGVLYTRQQQYKKGAEYFEASLERNPYDLTVRSNLAEAYRKLKALDRAEEEYQSVLGVTSCHVESYIGLGEVYTDMGDGGNADAYEEAVRNFSEALLIAGLGCASKKLRPRELAALRYARGYARVKLHESSKKKQDESSLGEALDDFAAAFRADPQHFKAKRAKEKIELKLRYPLSQQFMKTAGPLLVLALSALVFACAQVNLFSGWPGKALEPGYYILASFGSLMFMIASLSLPQLLKFKVAGIELEKSTIDQITVAETFKMSRAGGKS